MGRFLTTKAWYTDETDPFKRAPSVMTYDRANNRIVTQDTRVWVAGLSDEGGVGAWLAAIMKAYGQPKKEEVDKLAQFVDKVVWGRLQYSEGERMYGVKKSLFFYDPKVLPDYPVSAGQLDDVDVLEQGSGRCGRIAPTTIRTSSPRTGRCTGWRGIIPGSSPRRSGSGISTRRSTP